MMSSRTWIICLVSFFSVHLSHAKGNLNADEIVKKADRSRFPDGDVSFDVLISDYSNNAVTSRSSFRVRSRGNEASLAETMEPVRMQGQKLLMLSDNLWFISPNIKRPTRVSLQQRLTGQVANGDIARTNFSGDYDAKLIGEEKVGSQKAYKLLLTAKRKDVTYNKLDYWVESSQFLALRINFYATSGKLLKIGTYGNYKKVDGVLRPLRLTIEDAVSKSKKSVMDYAKIKKEKFDDSTFNKESL